jgi:indolepyruvate decarboxylase
LPELIGKGSGYDVRTELELDAALNDALANTKAFSILNVHLSRTDRSPAMARLAERLGRKL